MKAAAEFLTPVTLELGGKSPAIVDASADLRVAAKRIVWSAILSPTHWRRRGRFTNAYVDPIEKFAPDVSGILSHFSNFFVVFSHVYLFYTIFFFKKKKLHFFCSRPPKINDEDIITIFIIDFIVIIIINDCRGQVCVAPDYVLAEASIVKELTDLLKQTVIDFYGTDPAASRDYSRIIKWGNVINLFQIYTIRNFLIFFKKKNRIFL